MLFLFEQRLSKSHYLLCYDSCSGFLGLDFSTRYIPSYKRLILESENWKPKLGNYYLILPLNFTLIFPYVLQAPGEIEAEMAEIGTANVLKTIFSIRKPGPPCFPKGNAFRIRTNASISLPSWLSEDELTYYVTKFDQKGFTGGLNYYRAIGLYVTNFNENVSKSKYQNISYA